MRWVSEGGENPQVDQNIAKSEVCEGRWKRIHRLIEVLTKLEMSESGRKGWDRVVEGIS